MSNDQQTVRDLIANLPAEVAVINDLIQHNGFTDITNRIHEIPPGYFPYHALTKESFDKSPWARKILATTFAQKKGYDIIILAPYKGDLVSPIFGMTLDVKNRPNPRYQDFYFELYETEKGYSFDYNNSDYFAFRFVDGQIKYVPSHLIIKLANRGLLKNNIRPPYNRRANGADCIISESELLEKIPVLTELERRETEEAIANFEPLEELKGDNDYVDVIEDYQDYTVWNERKVSAWLSTGIRLVPQKMTEENKLRLHPDSPNTP